MPLFQGSAGKDQVAPVISQILEAGAQMGLTARIVVAAQDTVAPIPPEHEAPLAAEEEGRLDEAITLWERVVELNPRDEDAKSHLSRVRSSPPAMPPEHSTYCSNSSQAPRTPKNETRCACVSSTFSASPAHPPRCPRRARA